MSECDRPAPRSAPIASPVPAQRLAWLLDAARSMTRPSRRLAQLRRPRVVKPVRRPVALAATSSPTAAGAGRRRTQSWAVLEQAPHDVAPIRPRPIIAICMSWSLLSLARQGRGAAREQPVEIAGEIAAEMNP